MGGPGLTPGCVIKKKNHDVNDFYGQFILHYQYNITTYTAVLWLLCQADHAKFAMKLIGLAADSARVLPIYVSMVENALV